MQDVWVASTYKLLCWVFNEMGESTSRTIGVAHDSVDGVRSGRTNRVLEMKVVFFRIPTVRITYNENGFILRGRDWHRRPFVDQLPLHVFSSREIHIILITHSSHNISLRHVNCSEYFSFMRQGRNIDTLSLFKAQLIEFPFPLHLFAQFLDPSLLAWTYLINNNNIVISWGIMIW